MSVEIVCRLINKLPEVSGTSARGEWKKQNFIVETLETYPRKICLDVFGAEKVQDLAQYNEGDTIRVSVNIESREYQGRWYTDVHAWRIQKDQPVASQPSASQAPQVAPMPSASDLVVGDPQADDLPF